MTTQSFSQDATGACCTTCIFALRCKHGTEQSNSLRLQGCKGLETGPELAAATFDPDRRLWLHGVAADGALLYISLGNAETLYLCTVRAQQLSDL